MKKILLTTIVAILVIFGALTYGSPYYVVYNIKSAIDRGDADMLSKFIDYPAVRESMKSELIKKVSDGDDGGIGKKIGISLASALADGLVDAMVTPKGLKALLLSQGGKEETGTDVDAEKTENSKLRSKEKSMNMGYRGINVFGVDILKKNEEVSASLVMNRVGIFDWKLVSIELPE